MMCAHAPAPRGLCRTVVISIGILVVAVDVIARGDFNGRAIWTYQHSDIISEVQETFTQRYEAFIRDRVFETHNLRLSFFFNDAKNLTSNLTLRRYRGEIDLSHRYYRINFLYAPRQTTSPLQLQDKTERTFKQGTLDVNVPKGPRLRVFYADREQYNNGEETRQIQDVRGDLGYQYKILFVGLNRWNTKQTNGSGDRTTVTGGTARIEKSYRAVRGRLGYERQVTERRPGVGLERTVRNETLTGQAGAQFRKILSATLSFNSRWQTSKIQTRPDESTQNDNILGWLVMLPTHPVRLELGRSYIRAKRIIGGSLQDYATIQLVARGRVTERILGQAQLAQRYDINSQNAVVPANLYFFSLRGQAYTGVDFRAELSVSQRKIAAPGVDRYQMSSVFDLHLMPRDNLRISPSVQLINTASSFTLLGNDRITYGLTANYFPGRGLTLGADLRRAEVTVGRVQTANSAAFNATVNLRNRTSVTATYAINRVYGGTFPDGTPTLPDSGGETFTILAQTMVTERGTFSLNFSDTRRIDGSDSQFTSLSYRQEF